MRRQTFGLHALRSFSEKQYMSSTQSTHFLCGCWRPQSWQGLLTVIFVLTTRLFEKWRTPQPGTLKKSLCSKKHKIHTELSTNHKEHSISGCSQFRNYW
jgi:hypothetical protein